MIATSSSRRLLVIECTKAESKNPLKVYKEMKEALPKLMIFPSSIETEGPKVMKNSKHHCYQKAVMRWEAKEAMVFQKAWEVSTFIDR